MTFARERGPSLAGEGGEGRAGETEEGLAEKREAVLKSIGFAKERIREGGSPSERWGAIMLSER